MLSRFNDRSKAKQKNDAYTKTMFNVNCPLDRTCQGGSGHAYEVLS